MKRTIILLKAFFIFLVILQGCNNIKPKTAEKKEKTLIYSPDLKDKYWYDFSFFYELQNRPDSYLNVQTYRGSLIFGKILNEKYDSFINRDIYINSQCILFNDTLYIAISNGSTWFPRSILLKVEKNNYEVAVGMWSDCDSYVFKPMESTLIMSSNEFRVGDTIFGEISLFHRDSVLGYQCDGFFMGVINQGTEESKRAKFHTTSEESVFQYK